MQCVKAGCVISNRDSREVLQEEEGKWIRRARGCVLSPVAAERPSTGLELERRLLRQLQQKVPGRNPGPGQLRFRTSRYTASDLRVCADVAQKARVATSARAIRFKTSERANLAWGS